MPQEKKEEKEKKKSRITWEHVGLLLVFVAVLVAVAFYVKSSVPSEHRVYGLKVVSAGDPGQAMKFALAPNSVVVELNAYDNQNSTDSRNGAMSLMAGAVAQAIGESGKKVSVYGKYADKDGFVPGSCSKETNFCASPQVIIKIGGCDCMRVQNSQITVEYTEESMKNQTLLYAIGGVFGGIARST